MNWYGAEETAHVVEGLEFQPLPAIVARIRDAGFNSVRLPWSDDLVANDIRYTISCSAVAANPEFAGRHPMEVLDAVVDELTRQGLLVVLDNHVSDPASCCRDDGNALWHNGRWSTEQWVANWQAITRRYRTNPAVVGVDLRNEPRGGPSGTAAWPAASGGPDTDWPAAAERADAAIHASGAKDLLTIVEGVDYGTNLTGVVHRPLAIPADRLVYSAHAYEFSPKHIYDAGNPDVLAANLERAWGFLLNGFTDDRGAYHGPAPVWVGEFGCNEPARQGAPARADDCELHPQSGTGVWFGQLQRYLMARDLDWAYWTLNATYPSGPVPGVTCPPTPDSSLTVGGNQAVCWGMPEDYGFLGPDWSTPKAFLSGALRRLMGR